MSRENRGKRYLFVCVHNSGRSQMAEAFTRHLSNGTVSAESAGTEPSHGRQPRRRGGHVGGRHRSRRPLSQGHLSGNGRSGRLGLHDGLLDRRELSRRIRPLGGLGPRRPRRQGNGTRPPHPRPNRGKSARVACVRSVNSTPVISNAAKRNEESRVLVLQDSPHTKYVLFFSATSATSAVVRRSPTCPQRLPDGSPPESPFPRPRRAGRRPST